MTRLALILSGGVSLGSYVGGAATEVLHALLRNRSPRPVTLDVVTGSSSGSLTAALVARALTVNVNLIPWIETAWLDGVDASVLLEADRPDRAAWLDVSAIEHLADTLIAADPASDDEPAPVLGEPLRVAMTLSNLAGIRYDFRYGFLNVPDRYYGTRVYADWAEFELTRANAAGDPVWDEVRDAALASAAFPFAFPPRPLRRRPADYPGARLPARAPDGAVRMWYVDGGLFENAPLGLAKRLVERDPAHRETDRRYILVEPSMRSSRAGEERPIEEPGRPLQLAGMLAAAVLGQSASRDWITANVTNARLEILEALVQRLPELGSRIADPEAVALGREIGSLAERVAEMKVTVRHGPRPESPDPALDYLDENVRRIEADPRYAPVLARTPSRVGRTRVAKFIFVLEAACGLRDKEVMPLYLVAPETPGELCGDFMANFGGLFSREWRANDFRAGRRDARRLLEDHFGDAIDYPPDEEAGYRVEEIAPSFESIPPGSRRELERLIEREADRLLAEIRPKGPAALVGWMWRPAVRRWATERTLAALRAMS